MTGTTEPLIGLRLRPESGNGGLLSAGGDPTQNPSVSRLSWAGTHGNLVVSLGHYRMLPGLSPGESLLQVPHVISASMAPSPDGLRDPTHFRCLDIAVARSEERRVG